MRLDLYMRGRPKAHLYETGFSYPPLEISRTTAGQQLRRGRGVQSFTAFILHQIAHARRTGVVDAMPYFEGARGSLAATLNNAISKNADWLCNICGVDPDDIFVLKTHIERFNSDFKTSPNGSLGVRLKFDEVFNPDCIHVLVDEQEIIGAAEFERLHAAIVDERPFEPTPADDPKWLREMLQETDDRRIAFCPPPPSLLVGRDDDLRELVARIKIKPESTAARTVVIRGWPGIGKTTIARALAHSQELAMRFPDGVLWANCGQELDAAQILIQWAGLLGLDRGTSGADHEHQRLAGRVSESRMLFILDDVWDDTGIRPLLIAGPASTCVVTTRLPSVANALAISSTDTYSLRGLSDQSALTLLESVAGPKAIQDRDACIKLVHAVQGLPLALQVSGRLLRAEYAFGWGVAQLLEELEERRDRLLSSDAPVDMMPLVEASSSTVAALLERSVEVLSPELRRDFLSLGCFASAPASFELDAIGAVLQTDDPRPQVRELVNRGLLEPIEERRFAMHQLFADYARISSADREG